MYIVAALYKFTPLPAFEMLRTPLTEEGHRLDIRGTLLLAAEGVNGTISGSRLAIDQFITFLKAITHIESFEYKESINPKHPFFRLKVRLKKEIVTLGQPNVAVHEKVGTYIAPEDWNTVLQDPDIVVIDNRNYYETAMGTFEGAADPSTVSFNEFPKYVKENLDPAIHKKVALFCTGGIRCEKSSSYMLNEGFETVYHLKGGILKYLETVPPEESLWQGECFVFDQRVGIKYGLTGGDYCVCFGCRHPVSREERLSDQYKEGIYCPRCYDKQTPQQRQRAASRHQQMVLAKKKKIPHIGKDIIMAKQK